jgi:hypothetical protein
VISSAFMLTLAARPYENKAHHQLEGVLHVLQIAQLSVGFMSYKSQIGDSDASTVHFTLLGLSVLISGMGLFQNWRFILRAGKAAEHWAEDQLHAAVYVGRPSGIAAVSSSELEEEEEDAVCGTSLDNAATVESDYPSKAAPNGKPKKAKPSQGRQKATSGVLSSVAPLPKISKRMKRGTSLDRADPKFEPSISGGAAAAGSGEEDGGGGGVGSVSHEPEASQSAADASTTGQWAEHIDEASGSLYWHNTDTRESTWQKPESETELRTINIGENEEERRALRTINI